MNLLWRLVRARASVNHRFAHRTLAAVVLSSPLASAHFVLQSPASWMSQDSSGNPQKLGPCGDEGGGTATGVVTTFAPGEKVTITIKEAVFHPGHYRIALAESRDALPAEPKVTVGSTPCGSVPVDSSPTYPVLADGVWEHTSAFSGPQSVQVTLPSNVTCAHCTLQIIEFMSNHPLNNPGGCFYHHCADIAILPAGAGGSAATGGAPSLQTSGGGVATGGASGFGGTRSVASGGVPSTGGRMGTGGSTPGAGGIGETGGAEVIGSGGLSATGGSLFVSGGFSALGSGGSAAVGGSTQPQVGTGGKREADGGNLSVGGTMSAISTPVTSIATTPGGTRGTGVAASAAEPNSQPPGGSCSLVGARKRSSLAHAALVLGLGITLLRARRRVQPSARRARR